MMKSRINSQSSQSFVKSQSYATQLKALRSPSNIFEFSKFSARIPTWSGKIDTSEEEYLIYQGLSFTDTCSIDYFLLALWFLTRLNPGIFNTLENYTQGDNLMMKTIKTFNLIIKIKIFHLKIFR